MNLRIFSITILLLAGNFFFCGISTAASTGTQTLKFDQTTEGSFNREHPNSVKVGVNYFLNGAIYQVPESDFLFDDAKNVSVLFSQDEKLIAIYIQFTGNNFAILGSALRKKYTTIIRKKTITGRGYMELYNKGVSIYLLTPFFFSDTSLLYIKSDVKERFLDKLSPHVLENEGNMLAFLVEKCFPPPIKP